MTFLKIVELRNSILHCHDDLSKAAFTSLCSAIVLVGFLTSSKLPSIVGNFSMCCFCVYDVMGKRYPFRQFRLNLGKERYWLELGLQTPPLGTVSFFNWHQMLFLASSTDCNTCCIISKYRAFSSSGSDQPSFLWSKGENWTLEFRITETCSSKILYNWCTDSVVLRNIHACWNSPISQY